MARRSGTLSASIGLGLFALALAPVVVLAIGASRLIAVNLESSLQSSLRVMAAMAAEEARSYREEAKSLLDSMATFPSGDEAGLSDFLVRRGFSQGSLEAALRVGAGGRLSLFWPPEAAQVAATLASAFREGRESPQAGFSGPFPDGRGGTVVTAARERGPGYDVVGLSTARLGAFLDVLRVSPKDGVAIVDEDGTLLAATPSVPIPAAWLEPGLIFAPGSMLLLKTGGHRTLAYSARLEGSPWVAIYYRDSGDLSPFYYDLAWRLVGSVVAAVILAFILGLKIRKDLAAPFEEVLGMMRSVAEGNYGLRVTGEWPRELEEMAESFNLMAENVDRRYRALQESEARYRSLFHDNPVPALLLESDSAIIKDANPAASAFYGYPLEELLGSQAQGLAAREGTEALRELDSALAEGRNHVNLRHRMKDGTLRDVEIYANAIILEGKRYRYTLVFDMTARRVAQEQLERALDEKVVLLKEIHHRVKNNLQIVASLLNLQMRYIRDPLDRELFKTSQNRVYSMSLTHELLYQAADLSSVNMAEYGQRLLAYLREAQQDSEARVISEFGHFVLSLDKALPCGLILNELVTNAIKYSKPGGIEAPIRILMRLQTGEERPLVRVEVSDHGPGLPPGINPSTSASLGFSLIASLARQLEGEVSWTEAYPGAERPGTRAILTFPFETIDENPTPLPDLPR